MIAKVPHPDYRADVDGLRAVAVLSVFFFHAQPSVFPNGFVGVDVFFVISGYLITKIILSESRSRTFSFVQFYVRRIRRIFPSLITVLAVVGMFAWLVALPQELTQIGRHIFASAAFYMNFQLMSDINYFDNLAATKPLLHLWSLSVEEQFYVVWPILIYVCAKFGKDRIAVLAILLASAIINVFSAKQDPIVLFYFSPARFWELAIGASINYFEAPGNGRGNLSIGTVQDSAAKDERLGWPPNWQDIGSLLGALLLAGGLALVDYQSHAYPGYLTLLPTVGTAMLLLSPKGVINRTLLSTRVLVGVGLISYPLYLWHWPILSFLRILGVHATDVWPATLGTLVASGLLAFITYRFVENPLRYGSRRGLKAGALVGCLVLLGAFGLTIDIGVIASRFAKDPLAHYLGFPGYPAPVGVTLNDKYQFAEIGKNKNARLLLLGDSHAEQYRLTLGSMQQNPSVNAQRLSLLYDFKRDHIPDLPLIAQKVAPDPSIKTVVLSSFWAIQYGSDKINYSVRCCGAASGAIGGPAYHDPMPEQKRRELDALLVNVISTLQSSGKIVYVVLDNPFGEEFAPQQYLNRDLVRGNLMIDAKGVRKEAALARTEPIRSRIIALAEQHGARIIDPFDELCRNDYCRGVIQGGAPMYKDYDHLSIEAVMHQASYMAAVFK